MFVGFSLSLSTHIEIFIVCMKDITKREIQNTNNTHTYMYAYIRSSIITRKKEEEKRTETKSNKQQRRRWWNEHVNFPRQNRQNKYLQAKEKKRNIHI